MKRLLAFIDELLDTYFIVGCCVLVFAAWFILDVLGLWSWSLNESDVELRLATTVFRWVILLLWGVVPVGALALVAVGYVRRWLKMNEK